LAHSGGVRSRLLLAAALVLAAGAAAARGPAGDYRLEGQPDEASEIRLRSDGRFDYSMAAGALDERAQGRWTRVGDSLRLTTEPKPVPRHFDLAAAARAAGAPLTVKVVSPGGEGIAGVDLRVGFADGPAVEGYTQEDGWTLSGEEKREPRWIELAVAMYGLASPRFAVDPAAANALTFALTPNDLGVLDFSAIPVEMEGDRLLVHRGGGVLRYRRQRARR
jgi:hypothetical protein